MAEKNKRLEAGRKCIREGDQDKGKGGREKRVGVVQMRTVFPRLGRLNTSPTVGGSDCTKTGFMRVGPSAHASWIVVMPHMYSKKQQCHVYEEP